MEHRLEARGQQPAVGQEHGTSPSHHPGRGGRVRVPVHGVGRRSRRWRKGERPRKAVDREDLRHERQHGACRQRRSGSDLRAEGHARSGCRPMGGDPQRRRILRPEREEG